MHPQTSRPSRRPRWCGCARSPPNAGSTRGPWFQGTGVSVAVLDAPQALVSYRQATTVIRRALRAMPEAPIGLAIGSRDVAVGFGIVGFAMRSARTLADALAIGLEWHRLTGSLVDVALTERGGSPAMRVLERVPDPELVRFFCEEAMSAVAAFGRSLLGEDIDPVLIRLSCPEPGYSAEYRRFFRCPVEFDCAGNELVIPAGLLEREIPTRSAASLTIALETCRRMRGVIDPRPVTVKAVESILGENLRVAPTMVEVADRLFVTERTLRRQLQVSGESFTDIRDRVRRQRGSRLVRETGMTIARIAAETGFGDAREFRRAYIRWNGEPPSRTRTAALGPAAEPRERCASAPGVGPADERGQARLVDRGFESGALDRLRSDRVRALEQCQRDVLGTRARLPGGVGDGRRRVEQIQQPGGIGRSAFGRAEIPEPHAPVLAILDRQQMRPVPPAQMGVHLAGVDGDHVGAVQQLGGDPVVEMVCAGYEYGRGPGAVDRAAQAFDRVIGVGAEDQRLAEVVTESRRQAADSAFVPLLADSGDIPP
ncbi:helix-turn-helix domain-containing protein [Nocardia seriolae]|uniref:AraC family transcriptional regulator n=1 Tax=Nocardia seriolae TaxID=37332 RepID=UPI0012BBFB3D|nr:AraC family transcriptional regulator [Nocardia seriolae]MTL15315.1 helix-turn-helix domain-containing protein [Nocardia seriolae]